MDSLSAQETTKQALNWDYLNQMMYQLAHKLIIQKNLFNTVSLYLMIIKSFNEFYQGLAPSLVQTLKLKRSSAGISLEKSIVSGLCDGSITLEKILNLLEELLNELGYIIYNGDTITLPSVGNKETDAMIKVFIKEIGLYSLNCNAVDLLSKSISNLLENLNMIILYKNK